MKSLEVVLRQQRKVLTDSLLLEGTATGVQLAAALAMGLQPRDQAEVQARWPTDEVLRGSTWGHALWRPKRRTFGQQWCTCADNALVWPVLAKAPIVQPIKDVMVKAKVTDRCAPSYHNVDFACSALAWRM